MKNKDSSFLEQKILDRISLKQSLRCVENYPKNRITLWLIYYAPPVISVKRMRKTLILYLEKSKLKRMYSLMFRMGIQPYHLVLIGIDFTSGIGVLFVILNIERMSSKNGYCLFVCSHADKSTFSLMKMYLLWDRKVANQYAMSGVPRL